MRRFFVHSSLGRSTENTFGTRVNVRRTTSGWLTWRYARSTSHRLILMCSIKNAFASCEQSLNTFPHNACFSDLGRNKKNCFCSVHQRNQLPKPTDSVGRRRLVRQLMRLPGSHSCVGQACASRRSVNP